MNKTSSMWSCSPSRIVERIMHIYVKYNLSTVRCSASVRLSTLLSLVLVRIAESWVRAYLQVGSLCD